VVRVVGLDEHAPGLLATAGPAGDLHQQLRHAFRGTEVGAEQSAVRVQNPHQGDIGKMMALGEHLRTHEDVDAA
jgi:hypothetical protein